MDAVEILARTVFGEAGGRPVRAQEAVAAVVLNRVAAARRPDGPRHWGTDIIGVCRAPFQFPCWNRNNPAHAAMLSADAERLAPARRIAARALHAPGRDPVGGATHYHDAATLPSWAIGLVPAAELGGLVFYRVAA